MSHTDSQILACTWRAIDVKWRDDFFGWHQELPSGEASIY